MEIRKKPRGFPGEWGLGHRRQAVLATLKECFREEICVGQEQLGWRLAGRMA